MTSASSLSPRRWLILAAFSGTALVSQMLWLNFAPLIAFIQKRYLVDESTANLLILVFPLIYVVLSIPAGILIDRKGYRFSVLSGSVVQALFSCVRILDESFTALLIGQIGIAVAQPFIVNGISKLAADRFPEEQGALANGIGTMGMFLGMAVALGLSPVLTESYGLKTAMIVFAAVSVFFAAFYALVDRENLAPAESQMRGFSRLLVNRELLLLFALSFLGLGFFNGLTAWLEQIVAGNGINAVDAGFIGAALIVGGIAGALVIPLLSDHFRRRKPFILVCVALALSLTLPLGTLADIRWLLFTGALLGFSFLPAYALLLEMCSEVAGEKATGAATGLLMLAGNAGGVVVIVGMQAVRGGSSSWMAAVFFLLGVLAVTLFLAMFAKETYGRTLET